ncbi:MAG: phage antirepressor KilAC domain-containing protein [Bifidobacterium sp.]|jgi:anti-repressor protein
MTSNGIQPFDFEGTPVRTLTYETGLTWWVLKDVCDALNLSNPTMIAQRLDDDEQSKIDPKSGLGSVSNTPVNIVNEAGLYKIILRSDKPEAKRFQRWVTHEVLPSIRRHGGYMAGQERMTPEQMALASMQWLHGMVVEQAAQLEAQRPKVLFARAVEASRTNVLVGDLAKILKSNGVDIGSTRLFSWMRENGYLMKSGMAKNMPTQRSMDLGLFKVKETTIVHADGHTTINKTPKVTGKGQTYFIEKFLGEGMELAK